MLGLRRILLLGTITLLILILIRPGYAPTGPPPPMVPPGFVELTGPRGITVLVGPLLGSPTHGYEREVIIHGQPPFYVSTEPGVTPQDIADVYG